MPSHQLNLDLDLEELAQEVDKMIIRITTVEVEPLSTKNNHQLGLKEEVRDRKSIIKKGKKNSNS
jgi:hypothetical protein